MIQLFCQVCGHDFEARRASARYCSPACKQKQYRVLHGQKMTKKEARTRVNVCESAEKRCPNCNRRIPPKLGKGRVRKFCSNGCRAMYHRAKENAAIRATGFGNYHGQTLSVMDKALKELGLYYNHAHKAYFFVQPQLFGRVSK